MSIRVAINHNTYYKFDRMVSLSPHVIRLRPAPHSRTPIEAYSLKIKPENHFINWQQDAFGNYQARVVFPERTMELSIEVEVIAKMLTINPFDFFVDEKAMHFPFEYEEVEQKELQPYLEITEEGPLLLEWIEKARQIFTRLLTAKIAAFEKSKVKDAERPKVVTIDYLVEINRTINQELSYAIRMDPGVQSCEETLTRQNGSCRDFAWLQVLILRHLGLASRFVSGYLVQLTADLKSLDGPSGPENDFTDLHAWTEVYVPGAGWVGLDATSGLLVAEGHIPLACTPMPESAAAVTGLLDPCECEMEYANVVTRIHETPRVTKPYNDKQWADILELGAKVETELVANDVRMVMGGEPTFVSIDDMDSAQWNTDADGEHKRILAFELTNRLKAIYADGGFLHYGQGKWYPGEPIPRWVFSFFWRRDRIAIWTDNSLFADIHHDYAYKIEDAEKFSKTLCSKLGLPSKYSIPAYEDAFYYLWEERKIPVNLDPLKYNLKDDLERKTLAKELIYGLDVAKGYVLPLHWTGSRWVTSEWRFRNPQLLLLPGNSPLGLRLPLKTLEFVEPSKELKHMDRDPFDNERGKLDDYQELQKAKDSVIDEIASLSQYFVKTALCVEAREGRIYIFMPPIVCIENYLNLLAKIEATAASLKMPIVLEGYEPPFDTRVEKLKVTPDPGVIEVNIHPSYSWEELVSKTETIYEAARLTRLGTEKFMLDGRHAGTGGGNHVTIGGPTPSDSPVLRRPSLLRSFITYWQHHPALSYLFASSFIGVTSQAPRVDEGRLDNLYELEIAFEQIDESEDVPFWITDRLFRNLLTDITGNTHRSEFCIDKLYSPDSTTGRLGILELRNFEMPPHWKMSCVQSLLVRNLLLWFWKTPYKHKLMRWGTELYDKYLIEHFVREDMSQVISDLNQAGFEFKLEWFDPFFEFRFPHYGSVNIQGIELDVSMGIEPWNVLGEEVGSSGTSRYVDSSVERVQVKVNQYNDTRYIFTCNGSRVPLTSTGKVGEYVAGIRYKAWHPYSALHPTIGVDTPLVFDVVDTWNNRSIGGFTYYVSHPGGKSYDAFPVNSYEAESRRTNRFWNMNHTPAQVVANQIDFKSPERKIIQHEQKSVRMELPELVINKEYPHILDLRKTWTARHPKK